MGNDNRVTVMQVGKVVTPKGEHLCIINSLASRGAHVRIGVRLMAGQSVTLCLRNGHAVASVVGHSFGHQAALIFEENVSVATILAQQMNGREREMVRLSISTSITVSTATGQYDCLMEDISMFGTQVSNLGTAFEEGEKVQIYVDGLGKRDGIVRWRQAHHAGIEFDVPLGFRLLDEWANAMNGVRDGSSGKG